ncbi:MAG: O-antigen ligase family protein [Pirellulaceae bacterium]|nr:O-antigen ligase family protein [Pirellulaceae bacterium]
MSGMTGAVRSSSQDSRRASARESERPVARALLWMTDLGLAAVIFVAPLVMGGRYEVGRLVYVACVSLAAIAFAGRLCVLRNARWRLTGAEGLLIAGLVLVVLQLVPLPPMVVNTVSPEINRLLPIWTSGQAADTTSLGFASWNRLSLTPQATQGGLVTFLAHAMLFLVVVQRIRDRADVERLLRWLALASIGMAALGLAQFMFGNGRFLWIYEHPSRDTFGVVKGTFQNQNHFAHFLILGFGPILWWLQQLWSARPTQSSGFRRGDSGLSQFGKPALLIGAGLVLIAVLLTFSRGGVVTACIASFVALGLMAHRGLLDRKALLRFAGLTFVLVAALAIHGYEPLAKRMATLRDSQSLDEISRGRKELWEAHRLAIPKFFATGTGAGSHREIYPTYLDESFDVEFTHGENGYLHLWLETGTVGLTLAVSAWLLACFWCLRVYYQAADKSDGSAAIAVFAGLVASAVHSLGDFVWYIPSCLSLTIVLAACGCRIYQLNRYKLSLTSPEGVVWRPRTLACTPPVAAVAATGVVLLSAMMVAERLPGALAAPHWDAYYKLSLAERGNQHGESDEPESSAGAMLEHLHQVLQRDPHNARAHLRLARLCLREFDRRQERSENPMPLTQIRDAALASQFTSPDALNDWLRVLLADNRVWLDRARWHTRQALTQCPLYGDGYVYLAELAFLDGGGAENKHLLVQQALTVRPYSGVVLLAAGSEAALAGDTDKALELWKLAFEQDPYQRGQIIEMLAAQMPPTAFVEHFQPDVDGLASLYAFYREQDLVPQALEMADSYAAALRADAERLTSEAAGRRWLQAASLYEFCGNLDDFVATARHAVLAAPNDFGHRRVLIRALVKNEEYAEAVEQLQWCISRKPDDAGLQREMQTVYRKQLTSQQVRN